MGDCSTPRQLLKLLLDQNIQFLLLLDNPTERTRNECVFTEGYVSSGLRSHVPSSLMQLVQSGKIVEIDAGSVNSGQLDQYDKVDLDMTDKTAAKDYITLSLYTIRQIPCKILAKMLVRIIEPKKKNKYPYKRGADGQPPWWPDTVIHKEPDHLSKEARVTLLCHLITVVIPKHYTERFILRMGVAAVTTLNFQPRSYKFELVKALFQVSANIRRDKGEVIQIIVPNSTENDTNRDQHNWPSDKSEPQSSDGTISVSSTDSSINGDSSTNSSDLVIPTSEDYHLSIHMFDYLVGDLAQPFQWSEEDGENTSSELLLDNQE